MPREELSIDHQLLFVVGDSILVRRTEETVHSSDAADKNCAFALRNQKTSGVVMEIATEMVTGGNENQTTERGQSSMQHFLV